MQNYIPVLRTSDSELRATKFLTSDIRSLITPVFELTRSRKTKKLPNGSPARRMEQLIEIYGNNDFILDVCTETDLMNDEMFSFFNEFNGYERWTGFLNNYINHSIIPCALYEEEGSKADFIKQLDFLANNFDQICIRGSTTDATTIRQLLTWASDVVSSNKIIIGGSVYFIPQGMLPNYHLSAQQFIAKSVGNFNPEAIFVSSSSFPKSVVAPNYGNDDKGEFSILEEDLTSFLRTQFPSQNLKHSDYASVHPIRYPTTAYGWVPRIDAVGENKFLFNRYRTDDGGYLKAAKEVYSRSKSELVPCWGTDQIINAAMNDSLGGRSPSYWISVRINQWITKYSQSQ